MQKCHLFNTRDICTHYPNLIVCSDSIHINSSTVDGCSFTCQGDHGTWIKAMLY